jgi:hypothetical protein
MYSIIYYSHLSTLNITYFIKKKLKNEEDEHTYIFIKWLKALRYHTPNSY